MIVKKNYTGKDLKYNIFNIQWFNNCIKYQTEYVINTPVVIVIILLSIKNF